MSKERLIELIKKHAVIHKEVTLSSGAKASYYIDLRQITLQHEGSKLIGEQMLDLTKHLDYESVGGLTMGADPVATAIMHSSKKPINAFVVRKTTKAHGLQQLIEGPNIIGKPVLIVEDSSTTGASALQAAKSAEELGANIVAIATVVDRNPIASETIKNAGYKYLSLITREELDLPPQ